MRPLTLTRPKALVPLLNKPLILHVLERLPAEVDEVIVAANYRTEMISDLFRREDVGRRVMVVRERRPLGTGGCLKNLEDRLSDAFLAFNADIVSSLAAADLAAAHKRNGGLGTIALWQVDDPSPYGVVALNGDRITKFVEKPAASEAPSRWVNAGAYAFEPELLAAIPRNRAVSLEREVFPNVVRKGLYGFRFPGYWFDVGRLETYLRATEVLLRAGGSDVSRNARLGPHAKLADPVAVAAGANVEGEVGPVAVVGRDCIIGKARLSHCALLDGVTVRNGATIRGSLVGEGCHVGPRAVVQDSILGDGATIRANAHVVGERVKR